MIMPFVVSGTHGTVAERYEGFSPYRNGDVSIIIATFDGDADMYGVDAGADTMEAVKSVCRMYQVGYGRLPEKIMAYDYNGYPALDLNPSDFA
jgi:hypothetical protein